MKSMLSTLPGAETGKYRWVLASQSSSEGLQQYFDTLHSLPWLEESDYRSSLNLETHMLEQLKALIAG
jgi:ATP-dependent Lon protease